MITNNSCELPGEGMIMNDISGCEIERLRPLTETPTWFIFFLSVVLLICLIAGVGGNASLFGLMVYVRKWVDREPREGRDSVIADSTTVSSIMLLCLVNVAISVSIAPVIMDNLIVMWLLGDAACKLYKTLAIGGDIMANFLILGIAYDRFKTVAFLLSDTTSRRRPCSISCRRVAFTLSAVLLTVPTFTYSGLEVVTLSQTIELPGTVTLVQIEKCSEILPKTVFYWSVYSNALVGFMLPLTMTVYYDLWVVNALFFSIKNIQQNRRIIAERRVALWTTIVSLLHFACCLPHWSFALYANIIWSGRRAGVAPSQVVVQLFGVSRFLSSTLTWIPAGMLNEQLELLDTCDSRQRPTLERNFELSEIQQLQSPYYQQHSQMPSHRMHQLTIFNPAAVSVSETRI